MPEYSETVVDRRWQAAPPDDVAWFESTGEFVAYHRPSGRTHLLNAACEFLLTQLLNEPKSLSQIVDTLRADAGQSIDIGDVNQIGALLDRLVQIGLVAER
jgi:PqqD family protein of HPr-rel-A system